MEQQYRFSPIRSEAELMKALIYLHTAGHDLCKKTVGRYLPVRGNMAVFCHDYEEYASLTVLCRNMTDTAPNYAGKYYPLKQPLYIPAQGDTPAATYEYLYIRRADPYRSQVGDVDFILPAAEHDAMKQRLTMTDFTNGARLFGRPEEDMIELWLPTADVLCYVAKSYMRDIATN